VDVACLHALLTLGDLELNSLTFGEVAVALHLDRRVVNKQVLATAIWGDARQSLESKVEPISVQTI
jgi:hypothetical protein